MASMMEYRMMLAERDLASVWPQWKIVRLLGTGAFGEVYEIQRNEYGRVSRCALKILRKENQMTMPGDSYTNISRGNTSEEFISTVIKEIDIMEKLKGAPNIVVIDDYQICRNSDSCSVLIRMELLRNLGEFITSRQMTIGDIIKVGVDICNALEYCEGQNIIHRDVKESNIFYSDMGIFKLGDFGISRQLSNYIMNSATLTSAGTISKMAPEVYNGQKYDNRVDIYSLGIVLYSLLNYGRSPFYPPYPAEVSAEEAFAADMTRIKGAAIPPLQGVDSRLNKIICKACSPKASARYRSAAEFRDALLGYYEAVTTGRQPGAKDIRQKTEDGGKTFPLAAGIAVIAAIVVLVGGIAVWYAGTQPGKPSGTGGVSETTPVNTDTPSPDSDTLPEEPEKVQGQAQNQTQEQNEDHYSDPEIPDEEEEEHYWGGDSGSVRSLSDYLGTLNTPSDSTQTQENSDGTISIKDENGNEVATCSTPSWATSRGDGASYSDSTGMAYCTMSYQASISASTYTGLVEDYLRNKSDWEVVEFEDRGESEVNGMSVNYLRIAITDQGNHFILYWGAVPCGSGVVSIASLRYIGSDGYSEFTMDEFLQDVACITIIE